MCISAISQMISASKKPTTVLWINKKSFSWTNILLSWNRKYLWGAITRSCLRRPDTNLPAIIKYKSIGASIFKDSVVILILVKLHTTIEPKINKNQISIEEWNIREKNKIIKYTLSNPLDVYSILGESIPI